MLVSVLSKTDEYESSNVLSGCCTYHGISEIKCSVNGAKRSCSIEFENNVEN